MRDTKDTYRVKWSTLKKDWLLWLLMVSGLLAGLILKPRLGAQVPIHWNIRGQIDGYASANYAVWFSPLLSAGLYLMLIFIPYIDPKRANYIRFSQTYQHIKTILILFFTGLHLTILAAGLGHENAAMLFARIATPLLLIFFGNVMGKVKHNYFVGIRTPWTIANPEVWRRTHRLAARIWVITGLFGLLSALLPGEKGFVVLLISLSVAGLVPVIYSCLLFRRLK